METRLKHSDKKAMKEIIKYVKNDDKLNYIFNKPHHKREYTFEEYLSSIIWILKTGCDWRTLEDTKTKMNWNSVYKKFIQLIEYDVIESSYKATLKRFYNRKQFIGRLNTMMTDTTNVLNKGGIDKIGYNKLQPKHKISKISLVTDRKGVVIDACLYAGNRNDCKIFENQIKTVDFITEDKKKFFLADSIYDTNNIRKILENKFNKIIIPKNKRNSKKTKKMTKKDAKKYIDRNVIEFTNNTLKHYKRINTRYDKQSTSFMGFVYLACMLDAFRIFK